MSPYMLATSYAEKASWSAILKSAIAPLNSGSGQLLAPMYRLLRVSVFIVQPLLTALPCCTPFTNTLTMVAALTLMAKCVHEPLGIVMPG